MQPNDNRDVRYPKDVTKLKLWQRVRLFERVCNGKKQYFSERECKGTIAFLKREGLDDGKILSAYICPFCGWWHFGHQPWDGAEDKTKDEAFLKTLGETPLEEIKSRYGEDVAAAVQSYFYNHHSDDFEKASRGEPIG